MKVKAVVAQLRPALFDPTNYSQGGFSVYGILQAKILEWVAMPFSRESSSPGMEPGSSAQTADFLTSEPFGKPMLIYI